MAKFSRYAFFNELSCADIASSDKRTLFENYVRTIKALKSKGFDAVRYEYGIASIEGGGWSIFALRENALTRDLFRFILSTARNPYIPEIPGKTPVVNDSYEVNVLGEWISGCGFTAAHLLDSIVVSLDTHSKWQQSSFELRNQRDNSRTTAVLNVHSEKSVENPAVDAFVEERTPVELVKSGIQPDKKKFHVRKDHGMDSLRALWDKLRNCEYVESVINSLEFNSQGRSFIEKCFEDGKIHIRITDSGAGYGMVIQTTGTNLRATKMIGDIIAEKYG